MITSELSSLLFRAFELIETGTKTHPFEGDDWKEYAKTDIKHVVSGLTAKSNQHCKAALLLLQNSLLSEAVILLRCAYEASILARYLMLYPEDKNNYLTCSDITDYRKGRKINTLLFDDCKPEQEENKLKNQLHIEASRKNILEEISNNFDINKKKYISDLKNNNINAILKSSTTLFKK